MRVIFSSQPLFGHWHPLVPLARALEEAGHEVAFVAQPAFCATIASNGFQAFPVGVDETDEERRERLKEVDKRDPVERSIFMFTEYFAGAWAEQCLPDMMAVGLEWHPDVWVHEDVEFAGCVAAEALGIPHATLLVTAYRTRHHLLIVSHLDRLRASVGLPPVPPAEMLFRYLLICPVPRSYHDPANILPTTAHSIRHGGFSASSDEGLPDWIRELPDLPTVYATLGTVANRNTELMRTILDALHDEPVNVILTTGRDVDPAIFGAQPPHIHIERYIPQNLLFPLCDLAINHGGSGTVRDALSHGIPMVIIPVTGDQPENGKRCVELGLAKVISHDQRSPQAIRDATREVLANPSYRENAERMREDMQAMPGTEFAVSLLERLAKERAPLIA